MKRLLHVFPSFEVGGQQMRAAVLANAMADEDVHNLILPLNGKTECLERFSSDVSFEVLANPGGGPLPARAMRARKLLKEVRPDLLLTYNWGSIEWAMANVHPVCPQIHIEDGFGSEEAQGQLLRRVLFRRAILSRHAQVVFPSRTLRRLARDVWKLPEASLQYIPNGLDLSPFGKMSRQEARKTYGLPPEALIIGTLATLRPEKNLKRLIDAFCALEAPAHRHLVLAGSGPERSGLEAYVAEKGLKGQVSFPGYVDAPHHVLPALDIFALSSDTEQMPLSVIEAMAAGLPVISTDVGDVADMVGPGGRTFVTGSDTESLTRSLDKLSKDEEQRLALGRENQAVAASEFNIEGMVAAYRKLYLGDRSEP